MEEREMIEKEEETVETKEENATTESGKVKMTKILVDGTDILLREGNEYRKWDEISMKPENFASLEAIWLKFE